MSHFRAVEQVSSWALASVRRQRVPGLVPVRQGCGWYELKMNIAGSSCRVSLRRVVDWLVVESLLPFWQAFSPE